MQSADDGDTWTITIDTQWMETGEKITQFETISTIANNNIVTFNGSEGITAENGSGYLIAGNTISGTNSRGIDFYGTENLIIRDNYIYPTANHAIANTYNNNISHNAQITENHIDFQEGGLSISRF